MGLFKALLICAYIAVTGGVPQINRTNYNNYRIPVASRDGRPDCPLIKILNKILPICSVVLPIDETSYFSSRDVLLCFGVYDTHYQLCKYNVNQTELNVPQYKTKGFCDKAKTAFEKYESEHTSSLIKDWGPRLKTALSDEENCTSLCIYEGRELNSLCGRIVSALELYAERQEKASSSKPAKLQPDPLNPIEVSGSHLSAESKLVTPEGAALGVANPAVGNQVAASPAGGSHGEASPGNYGVASMSEGGQGGTGSVVGRRVEGGHLATKPQSTLPKLSDPTVLPVEQPLQPQPSLVVPKAPEVAASKPEKTAGEPAEESSISLNTDNEEVDQQSQNPDLVEPEEDVPDELAKLSDADKDIGEPSKMEEVQRPLMMGRLDDDEESNLVTYFILMTGGALLFYVAFHNKNKLLALALEGRRANRRGGRHSSAAYSKLHSNLEEAIAAGPNSPSATHVLY